MFPFHAVLENGPTSRILIAHFHPLVPILAMRRRRHPPQWLAVLVRHWAFRRGERVIGQPRDVLEHALRDNPPALSASAWNPVFGVAPADLVDAIVTEKAVVREPNTEKMKVLWD